MKKISKNIALLGLIVLTAGCTREKVKVVEVPAARAEVATLTRNLDMVDQDGRHYGTVELDPVNGGKVLDASGRLIGRIVPRDSRDY